MIRHISGSAVLKPGFIINLNSKSVTFLTLTLTIALSTAPGFMLNLKLQTRQGLFTLKAKESKFGRAMLIFIKLQT